MGVLWPRTVRVFWTFIDCSCGGCLPERSPDEHPCKGQDTLVQRLAKTPPSRDANPSQTQVDVNPTSQCPEGVWEHSPINRDCFAVPENYFPFSCGYMCMYVCVFMGTRV